ncbi:MAG TPA: SGNH/GDSL hydrolase family protein [Rhodanobacter sp.]|jgi:lysophospholipase L1-like esterase|nr:SGNH/GDSL hydrolase family protein [Rhodanobacter sp.]
MTAALSPLRFLALGDSYTIGEAVPAAACWPSVLARRLRLSGVVIDDPHIVAMTGWTTDELAHGMDEAALAPPYDLVTLQIGVNNQYRDRGADDYRREFAHLLARAITQAGHRPGQVVVVSIPDWGVTPFAHAQRRDPTAIAAALDAFNAIAHQHADRAGTRFVDITTISRQAPHELASDGLHPSAAQYARWVEAILPVMRKALAATP